MRAGHRGNRPPGPLDLTGEITQKRGRLIIAGYSQVDMQSWNWKGLDVVNARERDPRAYREGMQAAFDEVAAGNLDPSPLYTHLYPLDDLARDYRRPGEAGGLLQGAGDRRVSASRPRLGSARVGWIGRDRLEAIAQTGTCEIAAVADNARRSLETAGQIASEATTYSSKRPG